MQRSRILALVAAAVLAVLPIAIDRGASPRVGIATAEAATTVDINLFFTSLSPHGAWIPSAEYNYIWVPTSVDKDWAPYTNGRWIYTDLCGWYFASDEPFADIVYHYGRWGYDAGGIGWYWQPGTQFSCAWVAWRKGPTALAWAPLPPQGRGYITTVSVSINIGTIPQYYWRVVPVTVFLAPQLRTVVKPATIELVLFRQTQPAGTVIVQNNIVVNNVITINFIEQQTKQKVEVAKVEQVNAPQQAGTSGTTGPMPMVKAFVAQVTPPPASAMPAKVIARAEVQAPTKGQVDATTAAGKVGTLGPEPGANPRCKDAAFAKSNPKDCAPAAATAATGGAAGTTTPPAGATGQAGTTAATGGAAGTTTPPAGATGQAGTTAATGGAAGTTTPPAGATGQGGANATATVTGGNPRCADATFAKNNPRACTPANAAGTAGANANATGTAATTPPAAGAAPAAVDPRCMDQAFARNNPRTCRTTGNANAGGNTGASLTAPATPSATTGANANANANTRAGSANAGGQGNVTVQGNVQGTDRRCLEQAFARNNPTICRPARGNAPAAAAPQAAAPQPEGAASPGY